MPGRPTAPAPRYADLRCSLHKGAAPARQFVVIDSRGKRAVVPACKRHGVKVGGTIRLPGGTFRVTEVRALEEGCCD